MSNYTNKKVYIGIDVHKKSYSVTAVMDQEIVKKDKILGSPESLRNYCKKYFQEAELYTAYEAGFCGFSLSRFLNENGINSIVVHPASIEIASRERVKTDKRDSAKIAIQLATGRLKPIYVPNKERENFRHISRLRETFTRDKCKKANQIKSFLYVIGKMPPLEKNTISKKWFENILKLELSSEERFCLENLISQWQDLDKKIELITEQLNEQRKVDVDLGAIYESVPGIGPIIGRILANELGAMDQFPNERALFSYTGLTPREYSSGEHRRLGHISKQGKPVLRKMLIQAAWKAIDQDEDLLNIFNGIQKRAGAKRAIVGIARRLVGRIRSCIRNRCLYKTKNTSLTM